ncbi:phosphate ABC transporter substrate-binding protein, PhoT family [Shimia gijangensis]|uniref:Phosphate ABC transporter substrate-binding protein, PhoT family n=1 Tax=Shimia gijangensis TaxID=1470563 RepID=A0A1M6MLY6_9RHOB|nr:phosphate ABC transporter substrate-binding/OmpA family protein [Shimia gijangensis]SHJ84472.1 phosphate ABC transporter substrate-binding protein, PhoT family [Shimia gijangensis]
MRHLCAAFSAALFLFLGLSTASAQDVTLTSQDGSVEISGTLLGFDGEFYRVQTVYGELTVDGTGVNCEGPACPSLVNFVAEVSISGAATMGDVLMPALIEAFALRNGYKVARLTSDLSQFEYQLFNPDNDALLARFQFHATNSDEGFADLLADEADIAMSLREIREPEARLGYDAGLGDMTGSNRSRVLALDGMVAVVSPGNPVRALSPLQLAQVFAGQIDNWAKLGGPNAPIALNLMVASSGMAQAVEDQLMKPVGRVAADSVLRHDRNISLVSSVMRDPFAIGIASYAETGNTQPLALTGDCGFSMAASRRTIKTEDYPLTAPMFLYFPARRLPKIAREFLAYTRSPSAQIVIRRAGFVDQSPEEVAINLQGARFANAIAASGADVPLEELQRMVARLATMKRLTTSFRFQAGSTRLDAQSRSNVQQLARSLEAGSYDARKLVFVGFSDGDGPASGNRKIALKRAETVRQAVKDAAETANFDHLSLEVEAFGEAMPMACDDSAWGRQVNRRVEVWVR